jgi:hypothetical protein
MSLVKIVFSRGRNLSPYRLRYKFYLSGSRLFHYTAGQRQQGYLESPTTGERLSVRRLEVQLKTTTPKKTTIRKNLKRINHVSTKKLINNKNQNT